MKARLVVMCCVLAMALSPAQVARADDFPVDEVTAPTSQIFQVGGTSSFTCNSTNLFATFADLTLTFNLSAATPVVIVYKISGTITSATGHIVTRVLVDGVEEPALRDITGNTVYMSLNGTWVRTLAAGSHTVTVEYRTPDTCENNPGAFNHATRKLMVIAYTGA